LLPLLLLLLLLLLPPTLVRMDFDRVTGIGTLAPPLLVPLLLLPLGAAGAAELGLCGCGERGRCALLLLLLEAEGALGGLLLLLLPPPIFKPCTLSADTPPSEAAEAAAAGALRWSLFDGATS
jgi:hypothetical protein